MEKVIVIIIFIVISNLMKASSKQKAAMNKKIDVTPEAIKKVGKSVAAANKEHVRFKEANNGNSVQQSSEKEAMKQSKPAKKTKQHNVNAGNIGLSGSLSFDSQEGIQREGSFKAPVDDIEDKIDEISEEKPYFAFDNLSEMQRAVVMSEVLGAPRVLKRSVR